MSNNNLKPLPYTLSKSKAHTIFIKITTDKLKKMIIAIQKENGSSIYCRELTPKETRQLYEAIEITPPGYQPIKENP